MHLGVAVSGGSDSMALLVFCHDWARAEGAKLTAFTVDHGLREEAAAEAETVKKLCQSIDIHHQTLLWKGWTGQGNLQDAARQARYGLLARAGAEVGCDAMLLGHTRDDQAETFLMRLARGSGVDGLSAMRADWRAEGMRWLRPLLSARREDLREMLRSRQINWCEDPSNDDPRFERVKMRQAMQDLVGLGLDVDRLASTAQAMSSAREALTYLAHDAASRICRVDAGDVVFDPLPFWDLPDETRDRLLADAIRYVSSTRYRPRLEALQRSLSAARIGEKSTLQGCLIHPHRSGLRITREPAAVADLVARSGARWDHRWRLEGGVPGEIRALGEGISQIKDWRAAGIPRPTLMASPAIWSDSRVIAVPSLANSERDGGKCRILAAPSLTDFLASILSH